MNNTNYFCELKCLGKNDFFIKFLSFTSVTLSISHLVLSFSFPKDKYFSCVVTHQFCSLFHSSSSKMNLSSLFNFISLSLMASLDMFAVSKTAYSYLCLFSQVSWIQVTDMIRWGGGHTCQYLSCILTSSVL